MGDEVNRKEVEAGLRFGHMVDVQTRLESRQLSIETSALVDLLIARGVISARELDERKEIARLQQEQRDAKVVLPLLGEAADKYQVATPDIPCAENLKHCRGACCSMVFHLAPQDLDEGVVRWDYARPYRIRQTAEGRCVHFDVAARGCGAYAHRPSVCRQYDCRQDKRVWADYERRIPSEDVAKLAPVP